MDHQTHILQTRNLARHFGGVRALNGVDVEVRRGSVTGMDSPS